jgi:uncharacterized membrane protein (GlpM family)
VKRHLVNVGERAGATFAQAFLAALTVGSFTDVSAVRLAAVAGGYSVAKYLLVLANSYLGTQPPPAA